jgi:hypothetical protein
MRDLLKIRKKKSHLHTAKCTSDDDPTNYISKKLSVSYKNGFGLAFFHSVLRVVQVTAKTVHLPEVHICHSCNYAEPKLFS